MPVAAGALALVLYVRTLAPGLTWAHAGSDGGDFLAAALTGGVPHPPGYPTYQLLLRAFLSLVPGDPARIGNWLSALCAACAAALLADLARRTLPATRWRGAVALVAALTWAASPTLWGQAVITEVYALNALVVVGLLWLAWRWREALAGGRSGVIWLAGMSWLFGLGLGNHLSLICLAPGLAAWLWANRAGLARMPVWGWIAAGAAGLLGLSVYAYLPLAAARNAPVNWGDPRTLAQFWWLISGRAYRYLPFGVELAYLPGRLSAWVADTLRQFGGPWGTLIALAGFWRIDRGDHAWWRLTGLIALTYSIYAIGYNTADSYVYLIPVWIVAALWLAAGVDWGIEKAEGGRWKDEGGRRKAEGGRMKAEGGRRKDEDGIAVHPSSFILHPSVHAALLVALLLLPSVSLIRFWGEMDLSGDREARDYVAAVLAEAPQDAVILTAIDAPTFALWYVRYGLGQRPDLIPINVNLYVYPWNKKTLAANHPALVEIAGSRDLPFLTELLVPIAEQQRLYRAEPLNIIFSEFDERPAGALVQMVLAK